MSILRSLNTGASGLRSHSSALGVTSDNIANSSTVGFKKSRAVFHDILGRSINTQVAAPSSGAGSRVGHIQQMWSQGALLTTDAPTDLALSGDGFFVVSGNHGGMQGQYYTRAGQFRVDEDGFLSNPDGLRLQGYPADPSGTVGGQLGDLRVENGSVPATPTADVDIAAQFNSNDPVHAAFDLANPGSTSSHSTPVTVYDSLGNAREVNVYYRRTGPGAWAWHAVVDGGDLAGGTAGTPTEIATGTLTFNSDGALASETPGASSADFADGAAPGQAITFDFGESIADGGTGLEGSTGFGSPSTNNVIAQDGFAAGTVAGVDIAGDGTITGMFTNGQRRTLGRIAVADFASVDGLERGGHNLWVSTQSSGEPLVGQASTGGRGNVVSGALEQSNVDLGQEFVDLIGYQRGFQANSRIITTADEMYGELVNLKR